MPLSAKLWVQVRRDLIVHLPLTRVLYAVDDTLAIRSVDGGSTEVDRVQPRKKLVGSSVG
jgi:hypothetical protein